MKNMTELSPSAREAAERYKNVKPLINAVDVACWALAVKQATKKGDRCRVDVKGALSDLCVAWGEFQIANSGEAIIPEDAGHQAREGKPEGGAWPEMDYAGIQKKSAQLYNAYTSKPALAYLKGREDEHSRLRSLLAMPAPAKDERVEKLLKQWTHFEERWQSLNASAVSTFAHEFGKALRAFGDGKAEGGRG